MKKILFGAVAMAAVLSSCSQNEKFETPDSLKKEIGFSTYVGTTTKATAVTADSFGGFTLNAYLHGSDYLTGNNYIVNDAVTVDLDAYDTAVACTTSGTYYWPAAGTLDFYGYQPTAVPATNGLTYTAPTYDAGTLDTEATLAYTAPTAMDKQIDLLVAAPVDVACTGANTDAVALAFEHALTQIQFTAVGEDAKFDYHIVSVTIKGVFPTNTYTWDGTTGWGAASGSATDYAYCTASTQELVAGVVGAPEAVTSTSGTMILVPQTLDAQTVEVAYYVTETGKDVKISDFTAAGKVKSIALNDTEAWTAGKSITYALTLTHGTYPITLSAKLGDWTTATVAKTAN